MAKRYRTTGLSKNQSYTIREINEICGISPQTIRLYIKSEGLPAMTSQKPFLIHGADYIAFIDKKKNRVRKKLRPGEFRCLSCGFIGDPFGGMADLELCGVRPRLAALCGSCERPVSLLTSASKLEQHRSKLDIANSRASGA